LKYTKILFIIFGFFNISVYADTDSSNDKREVVDHMIDVGTHKLNFKVIEGKLPAIVFESGFGMDASQWDSIQIELSKKIPNAIISYDRAGMGESDLPSDKYIVESEVDHLRKALTFLNYHKQVILVGHSYGGLLINQYFASNRESVKGLLYVDPSTIPFYLKTKTIEEVEGRIKNYNSNREYSKSMLSYFRIWREFETSLKALDKLEIKTDIPKYLISSTKDFFSVIPENKVWRDEHVVYAKQINAIHLIAEDSAHDIPNEKPEIVLSTIYKMLNIIN